MAEPGRSRFFFVAVLAAAFARRPIGVVADTSLEQCQSDIQTEHFRITVAQVAFQQLNDTAASGRAQHSAAVRALAQSRLALRDAETARTRAEQHVAELRAQIAEAEQNVSLAHSSEVAARTHAASVAQNLTDLQRQIGSGGTPTGAAARGVSAAGLQGWGVSAFLRGFAYQKLLALAIGTAGLLSILDAALFTQCMAVGATAIAVGVFSHRVANDVWKGNLNDVELFIFGVEGSVITVVAAHVGFEGFELVVGVCLALGAAHMAAQWAGGESWQPHATFAWFALSTLLGLTLMQGSQKAVCAVLGSVGGGLMAATSCIFFWFSFSNAAGVSSPCWIDFVGVLDAGGGLTRDFAILRTVGYAVWVAVASVGASRYFLRTPEIRSFDRWGKDAVLDDEYQTIAC